MNFALQVDDLRSQLSVRRNNSEDVIITSAGGGKSGTLHPELVLHPDTSRVRELESELKSLRDESRKLKEEKEDLQAQVINGGVNAGRMVLQNAASISIADELGSLSDNQVFIKFHPVPVFGLFDFVMRFFPLFFAHLVFLHTCRSFLTYPLLRSTRR